MSGDVFGVISMFWSVTVMVSVEYVVFILRADNCEGGVIALAALVCRVLGDVRGGRRRCWRCGVRRSLFFVDSVIT